MVFSYVVRCDKGSKLQADKWQKAGWFWLSAFQQSIKHTIASFVVAVLYFAIVHEHIHSRLYRSMRNAQIHRALQSQWHFAIVSKNLIK